MSQICTVKLLIPILLFLSCFTAMSSDEPGLKQHIQIVSENTVNTVPFAIVYVEELDQEFMADEYGNITLSLKKGEYHMYVSSLGFEERMFELKVKTTSFTPLQLASTSVTDNSIITSEK